MCNHIWELEEDSLKINLWAFAEGNHNGPKCIVCGHYFCVSCKDYKEEIKKPCKVMSRLINVDVADFIDKGTNYGICFLDGDGYVTLAVSFDSLEQAIERARVFETKYPNFTWFVKDYTVKLISV